jgi:hypothetical protein
MANKDDTVTIDISGLTLDTEDLYIDNNMSTITLSSSIDTISVDSNYTVSLDDEFDFSSITITGVEFEDTMPELERVQNMCMHYPALAKAYENFKTIYKMVDQDYKGNYEDDL